MKRLFILLSVFTFAALFSFIISPAVAAIKLPFFTGFKTKSPAKTTPVFAEAATAEYGLIGENVILYNSEMQAITTLPATYFVVITGENDSHYAVTYNDLSGYVEKIRVFKIDYEPRLKFAVGFFTAANDTHPVIIRSAPTSSAQQVSQIPHGEKAYYYGTLTGEALIPAAGNVWYYVKFSDAETRYGYVYSAQGTADAFAVNPGDKVPSSSEPASDPSGGGGFPDWVFILLLCVPAVVIMLALFGRGSRKTQNNEKIN